MWREKVLEQKAKLGVSTKTMSERSRLGLSEWTITRILSSKTKAPRIDSILDIGETVGLSPQELFSETISVVGDKSYAELLSERDALLESNQSLTVKVDTLQKEKSVLEKELEHKEETVKLKDKIISLLELTRQE
jgi:hypothetical protein